MYKCCGKSANKLHSHSSNLRQSWPIKIIFVSENSLHSREYYDTKFIIFDKVLIKIEFLKTKFNFIIKISIFVTILPNMINLVSEDSRECGDFFETKFVLIGQDWRKLEQCEGLFALFPRSHFSRNINKVL
jgi:hypothetical protein